MTAHPPTLLLDATADTGIKPLGPAADLDTYAVYDSESTTVRVMIGMRSPQGRKFRSRYRLLIRALFTLPALAALIGFGLAKAWGG